jgi:hypothetical protein
MPALNATSIPATLSQLRAGALVVGSDGFISRIEQLAALTPRRDAHNPRNARSPWPAAW